MSPLAGGALPFLLAAFVVFLAYLYFAKAYALLGVVATVAVAALALSVAGRR